MSTVDTPNQALTLVQATEPSFQNSGLWYTHWRRLNYWEVEGRFVGVGDAPVVVRTWHVTVTGVLSEVTK